MATTLMPTVHTVPPGTKMVRAPYELKRKNESISHSFLVSKDGVTDPMEPDIHLQTKNALLHSAVYINAQEWVRAVSIHTQTKNADLVLEVHTLQDEQAVEVRGITKNGRIRASLPRDFKGSLDVSIKNGRCTLSRELRRVAIRVPSRYEKMIDDSDKDSFEPRISLGNSTGSLKSTRLSDGVHATYEINGGGPSAAVLDTKNGNIWVGFVRPEEYGCWGTCSIM